MSSKSLEEWLESERTGQWGALRQHTRVLKALLEHEISSDAAAEQLLDDAMLKRKESDTAWRLSNLLFHAAASLPRTIDDVVQLIFSIRRLPPSPDTPNKLIYNFWMDWRDAYGFFQTWRTLDGAKADLSRDNLTGAERWINFTAFSAKLVQQGDDQFARECGIQGFFDIRNSLETTVESHAGTLLATSVVTAEKSLSDDVEAAAYWVINAGVKLHGLSNETFGNAWAKGLGKETELWKGPPGLSSARWKFWSEQFDSRAEEIWMTESAKKAAREASTTIQKLL